MEMNPYAPPQADLTTSVSSQAEALREQHINTEATIKSVGFLYYLGALLLIGLGVLNLSGNPVEKDDNPLVMGVIFTVLGLAQGWVAFGLRRLRSWARIPTILFSIIGLLGFPIGTLINAYIIAKVAGKQGKFVMSPKYQAIIAATPHVKRKTAKAVWIILFILVGVLAVSIFMATRQG